MFILGHTPSFFVLLCLASFFWVFRYWPGFYLFRYSPKPFFGTRPNPSPVLARIWPFSGTCPDPSPELAQTFFRYLPRFYPFPGTRPDPSFVLARTFLRYSLGFYPSPVLVWTLFRYSPRPFSGTRPDCTPFSVLARTLFWYSFGPFFGTCPNLIPRLYRILQYSLGYDFFSSTCPKSTILRYSPRFYHFSVLAHIRSLLGTRLDTILSVLDYPVLAQIRSPVCLVFSGTRRDTISFSVSCPNFLIFSSIAFGFL